jgi:hypothetical protein
MERVTYIQQSPWHYVANMELTKVMKSDSSVPQAAYHWCTRTELGSVVVDVSFIYVSAEREGEGYAVDAVGGTGADHIRNRNTGVENRCYHKG